MPKGGLAKRVLKAIIHPRRTLENQLRKRKIPWVLCEPRYVIIEPTARCNLNCVMCMRRYMQAEIAKKSGYMTWATFERILPFLSKGMLVCLSGFGEALLHPLFTEMLRRVKIRGCTTTLFSNGLLISPNIARAMTEFLDILHISIDAATRETYAKIRGGDFDLLMKNLLTLKKVKEERGASRPHLTLEMVGQRSNIAELPDLVSLAPRVGAEAVRVVHLAVGAESMEEESLFRHREMAARLFAAASIRGEELGVEVILPDLCENDSTCDAFFESLFVTWDGLVMPCDLERFVIGDLSERPLWAIWNGKELRRLRTEAYRNREEVCSGCYRLGNKPDAWVLSYKLADRSGRMTSREA